MELTNSQADNLDQEPILIERVAKTNNPTRIPQHFQYRSGDHRNAKA